jgi:hypothetical protein
MRNLKLFFIVSVLAISFLPAQDYNITGAGARAEGFGGAYIGLADDATAVVWNPAGLSQLEKPEASIVTRFVSNTSDYKYANNSSLDYSETQGNFSLNFLSFALPISSSNKMVLAVALQRQLDFNGNLTEQYESGGYTFINSVNSSGKVNTITPAISMKLGALFSVGLSANFWVGNLDYKTQFKVLNSGRDINEFKIDYSGFNLVIGGLVDFENQQNGAPLKIGVALRTPFTLKGNGTINQDYQVTDVGTRSLDATQEISMPVMFGLGASYRIGDNFTLAADMEIRNYGDKKIKNAISSRLFNISGTSEQNISESGANLNEVRLGAEYLIVLAHSVIPLRLGFKSVPTTLADYTYDYTKGMYVPTTNQVKGGAIALGSGYITDSFALDITLSSLTYTQKYDTDGQIDYTTGVLSTSLIFYF